MYEVYRYSDDLGGDYETPHLHETTDDLAEAQGAELAAMRADLQAERDRARRPWWRRLFGGSRDGGGGRG